jgi:hypothetical protein
VTFWVQWDTTWGGRSSSETGAGTQTSDSKFSQHAVARVEVPIPLPSPNTNNPPWIHSDQSTPDSWHYFFDRVCLGKCTTVEWARTGRTLGVGAFAWPDPRGTKLASWKGDVGFTSFLCWAPPDQNEWLTAIVKGVDFEAIAKAKGKQWTVARSSGDISRSLCTAHYSWHGTLRITLDKPATVKPPAVKSPKAKPPKPSSGGGCAAHVASVTFHGSAPKPSIVVRGACLGRRPPPNPAQHPSGLNGCPVVAADNGYDYGTSLYIAVPSKGWAGGRYRPSLNETDCIDLVVTKFTPTEVDFHFGRSYTSFYPKFSLDPGTPVTVVVNGASLDTRVKYK